MLKAPFPLLCRNNEIHAFSLSLSLSHSCTHSYVENSKLKETFILVFVPSPKILSIEIPYFEKGMLCVLEL